MVLLTGVAPVSIAGVDETGKFAANTLPIVIDNTNSTKKTGQLAGALERTNNFLVPVISSDTVVRLLDRSS